jgi:hypothetical protein
MGGWTREGLERYTELMKMNKAARGTPACLSLEDKVLVKIRVEAGISGTSHKHQVQIMRGSRAAAVVPAPAPEIKDLFDEDEED